MGPTATAKVTIAARVTPSIKARIAAAAKAQGMRPSEWSAIALETSLDRLPGADMPGALVGEGKTVIGPIPPQTPLNAPQTSPNPDGGGSTPEPSSEAHNEPQAVSSLDAKRAAAAKNIAEKDAKLIGKARALNRGDVTPRFKGAKKK